MPALARRLPLAAALLALAPPAAAQYTWTGGAGSGSWNAPGNWSGGRPAPGTTTVVTLAGTTQTDTTQDISPASAFQLNQLILDSSAANGFTVTGGPLQFAGAGAQIQANVAGKALRVNSAVEFAAATTLDITADAAGYELILAGPVSGTGTVTKMSSESGNLNPEVVLFGRNGTFAGTWNNNLGTTYLGAANALGRAAVVNTGVTATSILYVGVPASAAQGIADSATDQQLGSVAGTGTVKLGPPTAGVTAALLVGFANTSTTLSGPIQATDAGSTFVKVGTGTLTYTGSNTVYAGGLTVRDGTFTLQGSGRLANSSTTVGGAAVSAGANLVLNNAATAQADRLQNNAGVTVSGGTLRLAGNANTAVSEAVGGLVVGPGQSVVAVAPAAGRGASLAWGGYSQSSPTGTVFFQGTALGTGSYNQAVQIANITFNTVPTLVGNGYGLAATNQSILPAGLGSTTNDTTSDTFVTYGTNGVRPIPNGEYLAFLPTGVTKENVRLTADVSTNGQTINSLVLSGSRSLTLNASVTLTAGAFLQQPVGSGASTVGGTGRLVFGGLGSSAVTGFVTVGESTDAVGVSAPITAAHLSKNGLGTLTLSGGVTLTASSPVVAVNAGTLSVAAAAVPTASGLTWQVSRGATLDFSPLAGGFALASGRTIAGAGTLAGGVTIGSGAVVRPDARAGTATTTGPATLAVTGPMEWQGGGAYAWQVGSVVTDAGFVSPYTASLIRSDAGALAVTATSASKFKINLVSLTATGAAGKVYDFDPAGSYTWTVAHFEGGVTGFAATSFTVDPAAFTGYTIPGGSGFSVSLSPDAKDIRVVYGATAVPEPGVGFAVVAIGLVVRRGRRSNRSS